IGYKDISRLDGLEQFMWRFNRSCLRYLIVYFFNIDNEKSIYKKDIRAESRYTLKNQWIKDILIKKDFSSYYYEVMKELSTEYNDSTNSQYSIEEFYKEVVAALDFYKISERMKLIDDDKRTVSVFIARTIKGEDGNIIDGREVWNKYIDLLKNKNLEYAEREVKLSDIRANMSYFIYDVKDFNVSYYDVIGDLYYIKDGDEYFKNDKVDKEKIITGIGDFI
ncbi:MAG: CRISPR-associated helicase/endonuclease Cas3, partial [Bacilli bacterium]|nr:CRISPR-associated helicase/endonuclease Cas3 [Bacilli bacterium]